ncbi:MAG TPA: 50S ribosomal protein L24 [Polyangiaceae bacterium LLY-WYZ-15_(1-7)]|nr:50S ribosomal protein L24 [Polyangiaceae bacterium LLY-WYZ-15_(1-7)]HJL00132.1 50S ribosomal protein L24 [Polyangiaceae bacterium LLY-WYZ-15_(1-7)]HJL08880.1 50S ribosomal protein L24 [Polyangiaceae bacterium LLY-WYZ-15_(1-7)]HJL20897.1 50S ribosomal protein L24 [Polyangiaceae bacterium LLY-WYZ-15_(1-7)]HJL31775.1 50S ribosomal protein L24 [Polyangiaceae bacterium LLY-WYZ-15_(1-7)]
MRIKKDDLVHVIAGKEKGKQGRVLRVLDDGRVIVEGINVIKRHQSPRKFREAGIVEKEAPVDASNVMLVDPETEKPTRIRMGEDSDGKKVRIAVKSGAVLD